MKIAIIGRGNVGQALAARWAAAGHGVVFGVRDPAQSGDSTPQALVADAAASAEVVVLAVPWEAVGPVAKALGDVREKLVLDCTNPLKADLSGLEFGHDSSGGERVAGMLPGAAVFKAFNSTGANIMAEPRLEGRRAVMFYCGDDEARRPEVRTLVEDVGFEAIDAGPMTSARQLEVLAMLWISLAYAQGQGRDFAFGVLRR